MLKNIFIKIKNILKLKHKKSYNHIRSRLLPLYLKFRDKNLSKFKGKYIKDINFEDVKYKLVLDSNNGFVDQEIYWKGVYEEEVMSVLYEQLSPLIQKVNKVTFLDVGCNIGQELIFATSINKNIIGIGFEPLVHLYEQVKESIKINQENNKNKIVDNNSFDNVFIYNYALGEKENEMNIKIPLINIGGSSLARSEINTVGEMREEKIKIKNGDTALSEIFNQINDRSLAYCKINNTSLAFSKINNTSLINKVDIIKIDVEGYEYEVLSGLIKTIKRDTPIIILEYSPVFYIGEYMDRGEKILKFMQDLGYAYTVIDGSIDSDQANLLFKYKLRSS